MFPQYWGLGGGSAGLIALYPSYRIGAIAFLHGAKVIDALDLPVEIGDGVDGDGCPELAVVHVPQAFGSGGLVVPEDVFEAVAVEVTNAAHDPLAIQERREFGHFIG